MKPFDVPAYATTQSVINAWRLAQGKNLGRPVSDLIGVPSQHLHQFGWSAQQISDKVFEGRVTADALLDVHSQLPLFNAVLPAEVGAELREAQRLGGTYAFHRVNRFFASDAIESQHLRRCPQCVKEDLAQYGVAHWRLQHQWPFARHCIDHGVPLQQQCLACGNSPTIFPTLNQMASDGCLFCGHRSPGFRDLVETNPVVGKPYAYWELLSLADKALRGNAGHLRPDAIDAKIKARAASGITSEDVFALTLQRWHAQSRDELFERFDIKARDAGASSYKGMENYLPLFVKLSLFSALR